MTRLAQRTIIGRHNLFSSTSTYSTGAGITSRRQYKVRGPASNIEIVYGNETLGSSSGAVEADGASPMSVKASVEYPLGTAYHAAASRDGVRSLSIDIKAPALCVDCPSIALADQDTFAVRSYFAGSAGTMRYNSLCISGDSNNSANYSGAATDVADATGAISGASGPSIAYTIAPAMITALGAKLRAVGVLGDSITGGLGFKASNAMLPQVKNWFDVAFSDGEINSINAGLASARLIPLLTPTGNGAARMRLKMLDYIGYLISQLGINDLSNGATWQQLAAAEVKLARLAFGLGIRVYRATLVPSCGGSSDGSVAMPGCGTTIAGQVELSASTARKNFNSWVRNGMQVDGSGTPVLTGGTPSKWHAGILDLAAAVEVDATNTLTLNGGFWLVPSAAAITGKVLSGTPSTTSLTTTGLTADVLVGQVVKMTSGAAAGQTAVIASNTTTAITLFAQNSTTQSGIKVDGLTTSPSAGDTFDIWDVNTNEGVHPAVAGHAKVGTAWRSLLDTVILPTIAKGD